MLSFVSTFRAIIRVSLYLEVLYSVMSKRSAKDQHEINGLLLEAMKNREGTNTTQTNVAMMKAITLHASASKLLNQLDEYEKVIQENQSYQQTYDDDSLLDNIFRLEGVVQKDVDQAYNAILAASGVAADEYNALNRPVFAQQPKNNERKRNSVSPPVFPHHNKKSKGSDAAATENPSASRSRGGRSNRIRTRRNKKRRRNRGTRSRKI